MLLQIFFTNEGYTGVSNGPDQALRLGEMRPESGQAFRPIDRSIDRDGFVIDGLSKTKASGSGKPNTNGA